MPLIDLIAGARPNFMKIAPIISAIREAQRGGGVLAYRLVHTGQHYDHQMSGTFFEELEIPKADINLDVRSGSQAEQTGTIMHRYEKLLGEKPCDLTVVVGDVNSTMACAITARKCGLPVAHVEAGIRSGDWSMPEEINRVVTDSISTDYFTTTELAGRNLQREGASPEQIHFVGNTMIDTLLKCLDRLRPPRCWEEARLGVKSYFVLTLHRPSNVDDRHRLLEMIKAVATGAGALNVVFPIHPRTMNVLGHAGLDEVRKMCIVIQPLGYLEFNYLVKNSRAVLTDSGGVTEEATVLGVPCITLRDSTERPETVEIGTNELIGTELSAISPAMEKALGGRWKKGRIPDKWDGRSAIRIVDVLAKRLKC